MHASLTAEFGVTAVLTPVKYVVLMFINFTSENLSVNVFPSQKSLSILHIRFTPSLFCNISDMQSQILHFFVLQYCQILGYIFEMRKC